MKFDHLFWAAGDVPHGAKLNALEDVEDGYKLSVGERFDTFEPGANFKMNPEFPDDTVLGDFVQNKDAAVLVSERVKAFLASKELEKVDFHPVAIIDHRGRTNKAKYWVVHPYEPVDIFDEKASGIQINAGGNTKQFKQLVLRPDAEAKIRPVMRIGNGLQYYVAVQRSLVDELNAMGLTGNRFVEPKSLAGRRIRVDLR